MVGNEDDHPRAKRSRHQAFYAIRPSKKQILEKVQGLKQNIEDISTKYFESRVRLENLIEQAMNDYARERDKLEMEMKGQIDKLHAARSDLENKVAMRSL